MPPLRFLPPLTRIDIYANRQLEQSGEAIASLTLPPSCPRHGAGNSRSARPTRSARPSLPAPSPAVAMKQLGKEIELSVRFLRILSSGPFPFHTLSVSQIPGTTAQAWPGLLYLPTFSYLPAEAQHRPVFPPSLRSTSPSWRRFMKSAHQWWGNLVGWSSYRDQWIDRIHRQLSGHALRQHPEKSRAHPACFGWSVRGTD